MSESSRPAVHSPHDALFKAALKYPKVAKEFLINVNHLREKELTSHFWAGTMSFVMRRNFRYHIKQELKKIAENLQKLDLSNYHPYVVELINYIFNIDSEHQSEKELIAIPIVS